MLKDLEAVRRAFEDDGGRAAAGFGEELLGGGGAAAILVEFAGPEVADVVEGEGDEEGGGHGGAAGRGFGLEPGPGAAGEKGEGDGGPVGVAAGDAVHVGEEAVGQQGEQGERDRGGGEAPLAPGDDDKSGHAPGDEHAQVAAGGIESERGVEGERTVLEVEVVAGGGERGPGVEGGDAGHGADEREHAPVAARVEEPDQGGHDGQDGRGFLGVERGQEEKEDERQAAGTLVLNGQGKGEKTESGGERDELVVKGGGPDDGFLVAFADGEEEGGGDGGCEADGAPRSGGDDEGGAKEVAGEAEKAVGEGVGAEEAVKEAGEDQGGGAGAVEGIGDEGGPAGWRDVVASVGDLEVVVGDERQREEGQVWDAAGGEQGEPEEGAARERVGHGFRIPSAARPGGAGAARSR